MQARDILRDPDHPDPMEDVGDLADLTDPCPGELGTCFNSQVPHMVVGVSKDQMCARSGQL